MPIKDTEILTKIWGITGGRRGNDVLVEGVAHALSDDFRLIHTHLRAPYKWLAPYRLAGRAAAKDPQIAPPFPDMVIASGRQAVPHARYLKRASGGRVFTVFLQDPITSPAHFDFVWAPAHDECAGAMSTIFSPHAMTTEIVQAAASTMRARLLPDNIKGKTIAVLIGGPNKAYPFGADEMHRLAQGLAALAAQGHFLMMTLSRRSPDAYAAMLRAALPADSYFLWDNEGENPYHAMLGLAEHVIVTADSVNMVGEACLPGVPVQVFYLSGKSQKFDRFHAALRQRDYVRPFTNALEEWAVEPQNATPEIAAAIQAAYHAHKNI
jgi:mitochondrial fission protein ELM1